MNENNIYQKGLIKKLKDNAEEINSLKEKISLLEKNNSAYINKILDLKLQIKDLVESNIKNRALSEEKQSFIHRIKDLENDIINITSNIKSENRQTEKQLENEINFYRGLHETGMAKVDAAENIIKLNNAQNKYIFDLEKELDDLKSNNDINICKLKVEHDLHFYNLKKKMMDYVKEIQHNMSQNNADTLELNSKLSMLYKNQMLSELDYQALQIEELLKIKEKYEKVIFILKQELNLHKRIEKNVLCKNKKYLSVIKNIDNSYLNISNSLTLQNTKEKTSISEKKRKKKRKWKMHFYEKRESEDLERIQLRIVNNIINNSNYHECNLSRNSYLNNINKKYYNEYISLKKSYDELSRENQNLKEQINTIKDKQKMFYNKFSGIIKLYKNAMDELLIDEEIKNKNIQINKEIIEKGNFDSFSKEQKYLILLKLVNKLLPLLDKNNNDSDIDSIKNSFQQSFNFKTNSTQSSGVGTTSRNSTLSKLTKLNFRSVLDNKISIYENKSRNYLEKPRKLKSIYKDSNEINSLKTLNDEKSEKIIKLNGFAKDKFSNKHKSLKLFKCVKVKNIDKPLRFLYIHNKVNIDYDFNYPADTCLTKNNFFN